MSRKLYVGNLPNSTSKEALFTTFELHGGVESIDLRGNPATGDFMGFACITMTSALGAQSAIRKLNGTVYDGTPMKVERWPTTERYRFFFR